MRGHLLIGAALALFTAAACPRPVGAVVAAPNGLVGCLTNIEGRVSVRSEGQPARRVTLVAVLRALDVVTLHPGASAELRLHAGKARYALFGSSRVRVRPDTVQTLQGPAPARRNGARTARVLSKLFNPLPWTTVVRSGADTRLGPRDPSPLFGVRRGAESGGATAAVTLRWSGPMDPVAVQQGGVRLRVQVREGDGGKIVLQRDLDHMARRFPVPAAALQPGRWYVWSVTLVGAAGSEQACGGPLHLLTGAERATLERVEREADALRAADPADPTPDLLRAEAYLHLGLLFDALDAYDSALRFAPDDRDTQAMVAQLRKRLTNK